MPNIGALPRWVWIADAAAALLVATAIWIAIAGGSRYLVFDVAISFRSPLLFLYAAASVLVVRHLVWPRPSVLAHWHALQATLLAHPDFAAALRAFVATRPAVFVVAFFAVVTIGLTDKPGFVLSRQPLENLPARFDAGWYGDIALEGYNWDHTFQRQRNIAFFPAMPMLMRPLGAVFGMRDPIAIRERRVLRGLWAGVAISLAAFLWGLHYLVRLGRELVGAERAASAALLLATYPFAVFFNAPYTESLFLLAAVGAFYHFRHHDWVRASCWGLVAGLARPNGCFVSVPLAILALQELYALRRDGSAGLPLAAAVRLATAAMPGIGMLLFTAYLYSLTGVWFAWARSHEAWGRTFHGIGPLLGGLTTMFETPFLELVSGSPYNALNAAAVLFALAMAYPVFRRLGPALGVFVVVNVVPPLFAGGVLSMGRLTSTLFPVFLVLATLVPGRAVPAWAAAFGLLQGLCAVLFFTWRELF